jgi:acetyl-CoA carboxylase biotin carboxyl carrier protein
VSLTAADVAEIVRLLEQSSFDELTLEMNGVKLSLKRGAPVASAVAAPAPPRLDATSAAKRAAPVAQDAPAGASATTDPDVQDVTSPLLGTFYRSPKPGAPPFIDVGSTVEEDTVVAIIEVMKLMNTVRASVRGTVTEILARDGVLVEYGETLLRVRKAD